jgi:hypothetical protein
MRALLDLWSLKCELGRPVLLGGVVVNGPTLDTIRSPLLTYALLRTLLSDSRNERWVFYGEACSVVGGSLSLKFFDLEARFLLSESEFFSGIVGTAFEVCGLLIRDRFS